MNKSKDILTNAQLMLLCDFLEEGYTLIESIDLAMAYEYPQAFLRLKEHLMSGQSFQDALLHFKVDSDWMEFFLFISKFSSYAMAMRGAMRMVEIKKNILDILKKQMTYPILLVVMMLFFSFFMISFIRPQLLNLLSSFDVTQSPIQILMLQFVTLLPVFIFVMIFGLFIYFVELFWQIHRRNFQVLKRRLHQPVTCVILQYYYSLKFACYYAALSEYVSGLYDGIALMYEKMTFSDLMVIFYDLKNGLERGESFESLISKISFFHSSFKTFWLLLMKQGKPFTYLQTYVDKTIVLLEKRIKRFSTLLMSVIYIVTGLFIVILYLLLMMPMMQIASEL